LLASAWRVALTSSSAFKMQRIPELRFSATLGEEPEIELALV
jgi:hypothetical protein